MRLRNRSRLLGIEGKSSGTIVRVEIVTLDTAALKPVATNLLGIFLRKAIAPAGAAKWSSGASAARLDLSAPAQRGGEETLLQERTEPSQALLHRLMGDWNPIHADPGFATKGGFPAPILHGLATLGICVRAIISNVLHGNAARVLQVSCRFVGVVFPGEALQVSIRGPLTASAGGRLYVTCNVEGRGNAPAITGAIQLTPVTTSSSVFVNAAASRL